MDVPGRHFQRAQPAGTGHRRPHASVVGHPDGGQSGRQSRRERARRRERTARRGAHDRAEPSWREHARDPQRERVRDPNGDALSYSWDLNGDKTYGDATGAIQTRTFASPGTFRVGVRVTDPGGSSNEAVDFVNVLQDKPPVVTLSASPSTPAVGAPVTFTATASDPDGTVAAIAWDLDGDGQFNDGTGAVVTRSFSTSGSRIVSVRATDNAGVATIAFRTIEVTGTSASAQGQPGPASAGGAPTSAASSAKRAMLNPFPVVRIRGVILRGSARLSLLSVRAPTGARVKVICHGGGCPKKKSLVLRVASGKRTLRVRSLERRLRRGAVIEVFVTAPGRIGKYTRFTIRSNATPARSDLCLQPGKSKPVACS